MCYAIGLNGTGLENLELDSLGNDCTFYFLWNQKQKMTFVACEFLIKIMNCRTMHNFSVVSILGSSNDYFFCSNYLSFVSWSLSSAFSPCELLFPD